MDPKSVENPSFGDPTNLSVEKLQELETVLESILALPLAKDTYAQIIDGSPIRTPFSDDIKAHKSSLCETIIVGNRSKPSDRALQEYDAIRRGFTPQILRIDLKVRIPFPTRTLSQKSDPNSWLNIIRMRRPVAVNTDYAFWR